MGKQSQVIKTKVECKTHNQTGIGAWEAPKETLFFKIISLVLLGFTAVTCWVLFRIFNRTKIYNRQVIDKVKGPYVLASNHLTMIDSFVDSLLFFKKSLKSYNNAPYHTPEYGNFYLNRIVSWYMNRVKCIPVKRGLGIDQRTQTVVKEKLLNGGVVHIFPEGTRSRTGKLLPPKVGVGKRIYEAKVKAVPFYHEGLQDVLPVGVLYPRLGKDIKIIVGEPVTFDEFFEMENNPQTWSLISEKLMNEIKKLKEKLYNIEGRVKND